MSETETRAGLTDSDCDALDDVWSEETTVSATAFYPVVARIVERRMAPARAELSRLRGVVEAVQALADEWDASGKKLAPDDDWGVSVEATLRGDFLQEKASALRAALAPVSSSGEAESGEAIDRATGKPATAYTPPEDVVRVAPILCGERCRVCSADTNGRHLPGCLGAPVSSGGQADGEGEDVREQVAHAILAHFGPPESGGGSWRLSPYRAADDVLALLAARPVLSREAVRINPAALAEYLHEWERTCKQMGLRFTIDDAAKFVADAGPAAVLVGQEER